MTRPYSHSSADAQTKYRGSDELADEAVHDPIDVFESDLIEAGIIDADAAAAIREAAREEAAQAAEEALAATRPDPTTVTRQRLALSAHDPVADASRPIRDAPRRPGPTDRRAPPSADRRPTPDDKTRSRWPMRSAPRCTSCSRRTSGSGSSVRTSPTPTTRCSKQVEGKGGVFGVTRGLQRRFGSARCFNTPLAESNIVGRGIGQAIRGLRPCAEIQFFDYIWPAMQQLRSEAATIQVAVERHLQLPARRAGGDRRLPDRRSDLALAVRRVDLLSHSRAPRRFPVAGCRRGRAAQDRVRLRGPGALLGAQAPLQTDATRPTRCRRRATRCRSDSGSVARPGRDLTIVTWGATVQKSLHGSRSAR